MISLLLLLAALPGVYWDQGIETADALRKNGIERVYVPPEQVDSWRRAGLSPIPISRSELEARTLLPAPGISAETHFASATRSPWIIANGWKSLRAPSGQYRYDLPAGKATLAAAEAYAYGADAILKIAAADLESIGQMLAFLSQVKPDSSPPVADLVVVDDGSAPTGEVMNLLVRRNLLFKVASAPDPHFRINIKLGTKEYPREEAAEPSEFALAIRRQLTDEKRAIRVYGSEVVICRLTSDNSHVRLHLLNYGGGVIKGLRLRLRGSYIKGTCLAESQGLVALDDHMVSEGTTEFSVPRLGPYAVIDLEAQK
jgi:hypothetical protein